MCACSAYLQGKYQLVYQRDGNLVLYQVLGSVIVWQAVAQSGNPGRAELQVGADADAVYTCKSRSVVHLDHGVTITDWQAVAQSGNPGRAEPQVMSDA
jgi:hypothetical protein